MMDAWIVKVRLYESTFKQNKKILKARYPADKLVNLVFLCYKFLDSILLNNEQFRLIIYTNIEPGTVKLCNLAAYNAKQTT